MDPPPRPPRGSRRTRSWHRAAPSARARSGGRAGPGPRGRSGRIAARAPTADRTMRRDRRDRRRRRRRDRPVPSAAMFERTALPAGPRVISARLPGARSVSIAAYVLAGSRLETPERGRRRPFHGAHHVQGHERVPVDPGDLRGDRGRRRLVQRRDRPRVDRLLGPRPAPRGDPGDGRPRRADRPAERSTRRRSTASGPSSSRRSARTSTIPAEYAQILFQQAMFGTARSGARSAATRTGSGRCRPTTIRELLADDVPAGEHGRRGRRRPRPRRGGRPGRRGVRDRQRRRSRASRRRRRCRPASARSSGHAATRRQAQLIVGVPALRRDHPDAWTLAVLNAVLGDGMSSRLFLSVREAQGLAYDVSSGLVDYADAGSLEVSAGVDPERLPAALDAILVELARLRDEPVPADELAKAKAYLSGGLELRMDETRHLASWIGGQEALHDRVLTLDEALAAVAAVDARRRPAAGRRAVPRRRPAARGRRAGPATCAASSAACGCRHDAVARRRRRSRRRSRSRRRVASPRRASTAVISPRRPGPPPARLARARPGRARDAGRPRRARRRRRSATSPRPAGGPATSPGPARRRRPSSRSQPDDILGLVIAAEAQAALGRPGEARRLAGRALDAADGSLDPLFAGMPAQLDLAGRPRRARASRRASCSTTSTPARSRPAAAGTGRAGAGGAGAEPGVHDRSTRRAGRIVGGPSLWGDEPRRCSPPSRSDPTTLFHAGPRWRSRPGSPARRRPRA